MTARSAAARRRAPEAAPEIVKKPAESGPADAPARPRGSGLRLSRGLASLLGGRPRPAPAGPEGQAAPAPALAPAPDPAPGGRTQFVNVPLGRIRPNAYQPRRAFDAERLGALVESVRHSGLMQPVVVRRTGEGFELIAGERRLRAAKGAGLETIPAVVRDVTEDEMLELALLENLQREDLNPMELARAFRGLVKRFGLTQEEVASRLSVSRPAVSNAMRLLELPERVRELIASGKLTAGHARAVLSVPGEEARIRLAKEIMASGLSVREAELRAEVVAGGGGSPRAVRRGRREKPPHVRALETKLAERLGTRVEILEGKRKGKIVIEFYSNEDFERITEVMGAA